MEQQMENEAEGLKNDFLNKLSQPLQSSYDPVKRLLDIMISSVLLIPASILILIFVFLVKIETPGKAFYSQERVGKMGKKIIITKIRSMYSDAEKKTGAVWAQKNDVRITKVGQFMRRTRIDELPQLLSVLRGDLSLIGPRPERPIFTQQFSESVNGFEQRLLVKPGLSGYAQIHGGYDDSPKEKFLNDMYYIKHFGLAIDFKIFFGTIKVVFSGNGAR